MPNHIHIVIGTKPNCNLSDLARDIKANSSKWANEKHHHKKTFKEEYIEFLNAYQVDFKSEYIFTDE